MGAGRRVLLEELGERRKEKNSSKVKIIIIIMNGRGKHPPTACVPGVCPGRLRGGGLAPRGCAGVTAPWEGSGSKLGAAPAGVWLCWQEEALFHRYRLRGMWGSAPCAPQPGLVTCSSSEPGAGLVPCAKRSVGGRGSGCSFLFSLHTCLIPGFISVSP